MTSSTTHPQTDSHGATLWCLHILGPDDVIAAPSREEAERAAAAANAYFAKRGWQQGDIQLRAVAEEYPYSAASHAESVDEDWADWSIEKGVGSNACHAVRSTEAQT